MRRRGLLDDIGDLCALVFAAALVSMPIIAALAWFVVLPTIGLLFVCGYLS